MAQPAGILPPGFTRYSTHGVPDARRVSQWELHNATALVGLQAHPLAGTPLLASELNLTLPRLRLARVQGTAHTVQRDESDIAAYPAGGLVAYFALSGTGHFHHRHGRVVLSPGKGIVYDADQPFSRSFSGGLRELVLKIPRSMALDSAGFRNMARPTIFEFGDRQPENSPGLALAHAINRALTGNPMDWDEFETRISNLLSSLLSNPASTRGYLATAQEIINSTCTDQTISAATVAEAVGLSERQLSRVFAQSGRSIPQTIMESRLSTAQQLLSSQSTRNLPLSSIAEISGFNSQSQFSRSYKSHFGESPLRHRHTLAARMPDAT